MLPQSRNTTVRSAMSCGRRAGCSPSSENMRYSCGSGRSLGRDEHRAVLAERASAGPASPRASRARRRRGSRAWRARSARPRGSRSSTSSRVATVPASRSSAAALLDQLLDAHRAVGRLVVDELERRRALEAQLARDPALQVAVGAAQPRERRLALLGLGGRAASPSTLTYTRAWRRSALVLTSVTVTNPTRGSFRSPASASPITWRIASSTRRIRPLLILSVQFPAALDLPAARPPAARRPAEAIKRTARARPDASRRPRARRPRARPGSS